MFHSFTVQYSYPFIFLTPHSPFYFLYRSRRPRKIPSVLRRPFLSSSKHTTRQIERYIRPRFTLLRNGHLVAPRRKVSYFPYIEYFN